MIENIKKNNELKFMNDVITRYNKYYLKYIKFLSKYRFELKEDHIINNGVNDINYIYNKKQYKTKFIFIGYVLSDKLFWIDNFNKKILLLIKLNHRYLFDKYNFSKDFIETFFEEEIQYIDHIIYLRFMFYLINMLQKKYKVIDIKDRTTNISIIGLVEIHYDDNFNMKKEFF